MHGKIPVKEKTCKTALSKTGIPGYLYCLNPYAGCAHGCCYCYASFMRRFTGHSEPWGGFVDVKVNLPAVLERELERGKATEGNIILGTVTDPYQPLEASCGLTRSCLEAFSRYPPCGLDILTKSSLVARDTELLGKIPGCSVGFTITTVDEGAARVLEPGAPPPGSRLAAARRLIEAGVAVWVFIAPLLPGAGDNDRALTGLFSAINKAGVREVLADSLNPYPSVVQGLKKTYRRYFPDALRDLEHYLKNRQDYLDITTWRVKELSGRYGIDLNFV